MPKKLTEKEILDAAVSLFCDRDSDAIDKEVEKKLFQDLAKVDGFGDYLRAQLSEDMKTYFRAATPMEQLQVRGMFARTLRFQGLLRAVEKKPKKKAKLTLGGGRYAS